MSDTIDDFLTLDTIAGMGFRDPLNKSAPIGDTNYF